MSTNPRDRSCIGIRCQLFLLPQLKISSLSFPYAMTLAPRPFPFAWSLAQYIVRRQSSWGVRLEVYSLVIWHGVTNDQTFVAFFYSRLPLPFLPESQSDDFPGFCTVPFF